MDIADVSASFKEDYPYAKSMSGKKFENC